MSDNCVPSAVLGARDINMKKEKFLLLGACSLAVEIKVIMYNFSKMWSAMVEVCKSTLGIFQKQLISLGPGKRKTSILTPCQFDKSLFL